MFSNFKNASFAEHFLGNFSKLESFKENIYVRA